MADAVPSPLREQIAHAIERAFGARGGWTFEDLADAVLPLVEAAADAAARAQLVESQLWISERAVAIREASAAEERLRLHTQLRDRRDAAMRNAQDVKDERGSRAELGYFQTLAEAYDNALLLLGVAATPPLADAIRDMAATVEARMAEYAATIRRLRSEQPRDEAAILKWDHRWDEARWTLATLRDVLGVAATPQPEEPEDGR